MFDYFTAAMKCFHCGTVSPDDGSTAMNTKLLDDAHQNPIPVGFVFEDYDLSEQNLLESSYEPTGATSPDGKLRLIQDWRCPTCSQGNLAQVTIDGLTIVEIAPVPFGRAGVAQAQYLNRHSARWLAADA